MTQGPSLGGIENGQVDEVVAKAKDLPGPKLGVMVGACPLVEFFMQRFRLLSPVSPI